MFAKAILGRFKEVGTAVLFPLGLFLGPALGWCSDWPQYRGSNHDGSSTDRIVRTWPAGGPTQLWRRPLNFGFGSFAVSGGRACTLVVRAGQETCLALDAGTGAELWATPVGPAYYPDAGAGDDDGPRSTPAIHNGRVYVLSSWLVLACLDAATGGVVWSHDLKTEYGVAVIAWQNAASPLLDGDLIFLNSNAADGALMAFRATDGGLAWRSQSQGMTHATPVAATIEGVRQIIFYTQSGLVAVAPQTGALLWQHPFGYSTSAAASPLVSGNLVYCSQSYGVGAMVVRVSRVGDAFTATGLWTNRLAQNHWSSVVCHQGYLYGLYGAASPGYNPLKCLELATGRETWSMTGFGPGGLVLVDNHLLVLSDAGSLVLARPATNAYAEVARCAAVSGKCWNAPVVSDGRIFARSTTEAVCLDVSVPALKLSAPVCRTGALQLTVGTTNASPLDSNRAARVELRASTNPAAPVATWARVTNSLVLTNGLLRLEDPQGATAPQRHFIAVEQPLP
jgi:outer membrane protein assembly factor BamB